jgi:hypothetical protein
MGKWTFALGENVSANVVTEDQTVPKMADAMVETAKQLQGITEASDREKSVVAKAANELLAMAAYLREPPTSTGQQTLEIHYPDANPQAVFLPFTKALQTQMAASVRALGKDTNKPAAAKPVAIGQVTVEREGRAVPVVTPPVVAAASVKPGVPKTSRPAVRPATTHDLLHKLGNKSVKRIPHDVWLKNPVAQAIGGVSTRPTIAGRHSPKNKIRKMNGSFWLKAAVPNVVTQGVKRPGVGIVQPVIAPATPPAMHAEPHLETEVIEHGHVEHAEVIHE